VHGDGLADNEAIADQLADGLARVGVGDLAHLIGIEPDLALAAADHGRRKALLGTEVDPGERKKFNGQFRADVLRKKVAWPESMVITHQKEQERIGQK
jgi:hypothetical protein